MKKFKIQTILIIFFTVFCQVALLSETPRILFLSHERSGTRLALYYLCHLLDRQVQFGIRGHYFDPLKGTFKNNKDAFIYATHYPNDLEIEDENKDFLIFIVRNYRETLIRNYHRTDRVLSLLQREAESLWYDQCKDFQAQKAYYFNNLRCFDHWNPNKRFLIYYEDLLTAPEKVLKDLIEFVGGKPEKVDQLLSELEFHKEKCLNIAFPRAGESKTRGKDLLFHSAQIGKEDCKKIDNEVEKLFSYYFKKYLTRYDSRN